jgi:hypothetical protein
MQIYMTKQGFLRLGYQRAREGDLFWLIPGSNMLFWSGSDREVAII